MNAGLHEDTQINKTHLQNPTGHCPPVFDYRCNLISHNFQTADSRFDRLAAVCEETPRLPSVAMREGGENRFHTGTSACFEALQLIVVEFSHFPSDNKVEMRSNNENRLQSKSALRREIINGNSCGQQLQQLQAQ